jgi:hypothetical protein
MSLGDEHGFGSESGGRTDESFGGSGQTRTRLPGGGDTDVYGGARRPVRNSRSLVTVVGVVVLLIAAIAFANQGGGEEDPSVEGAKGAGPQPTAATGVKPVTGKNGRIPVGYAKNEQGAQSAASNYAVALGSDGMFKKDSRHTIVDTLYTPEAAARLKPPMDQAYSADFLKKLGLDANGNPPTGSTFVSRAIPVGAKVDSFTGDTTRVSVWYTGLIGMSGPRSTDPVHTTWKTWTFDMKWTGNDWKITADSEKDGPAPVPGDTVASTSDEISKAVAEFGGFTYAR